MEHPLNTQPFTQNHTAPCDVAQFQQGLTNLFGVETLSRRPWVRVLWMPSQAHDRFGFAAKDWDEYGNGGRGEWRLRYLYSATEKQRQTMNQETGLLEVEFYWEDVAPPRFVLESLIPEHLAAPGWKPDWAVEQYGFYHGKDADGTPYTSRKPIGGLYQAMIVDDQVSIRGGVIADHDEHCCKRANVEQVQCYGLYAEPGARHLNVLREFIARNRDKDVRPHLITKAEQGLAQCSTAYRYENYYRDLEAEMSQIALESLVTHSAMLSDSTKRQQWGKFHFVGENTGHSKSGLILTGAKDQQ